MKNKDLKKPLQTINQSPGKQQGSFIDFNQNFSKTVSNQDNYNTNDNIQNYSNVNVNKSQLNNQQRQQKQKQQKDQKKQKKQKNKNNKNARKSKMFKIQQTNIQKNKPQQVLLIEQLKKSQQQLEKQKQKQKKQRQRRLISLPQSCTDDIDLIVEQMKKAKYSMIQKMKQDGCNQQFIQQMCNQIQSLCEQTWLDFTSIVQFKKNLSRKQKAPIKIKLNENIKNSNDIGMNLLQLAIKKNSKFKQEEVQFDFNPQQKLRGYIPTITNIKQNNEVQHIDQPDFIEIVSKNILQDSKERVKGFEQYTTQLQINFQKLIPIIQRDRHKVRKRLQFPPNYVLDARAINMINSKNQSNVKGFKTISRRKPL